MAWEVAVIVDPHCSDSTVDLLARYMPLWIVDTPSNLVCATTARQAASEMWLPEAVCTVFKTIDLDDREYSCLSVLDMVDLHHPSMAKLNLIGVVDSETLRSGMKEFNFIPAKTKWDNTIAFRRPVAMLDNVTTLQLDASPWKNTDDIYESLFAVLGAPAWHGKNFDALNDSIVTGNINVVEVPYILSIHNMKAVGAEVNRFVSNFAEFISEREAEGCPVSIQIEDDPK